MLLSFSLPMTIRTRRLTGLLVDHVLAHLAGAVLVLERRTEQTPVLIDTHGRNIGGSGQKAAADPAARRRRQRRGRRGPAFFTAGGRLLTAPLYASVWKAFRSCGVRFATVGESWPHPRRTQSRVPRTHFLRNTQSKSLQVVTLNAPRMNRRRDEKSSGCSVLPRHDKPAWGAPQAARARTAPSRAACGDRPVRNQNHLIAQSRQERHIGQCGRGVYDYKIAILPEIIQQFRHLGRSPQGLRRSRRPRGRQQERARSRNPSTGRATRAPSLSAARRYPPERSEIPPLEAIAGRLKLPSNKTVRKPRPAATRARPSAITDFAGVGSGRGQRHDPAPAGAARRHAAQKSRQSLAVRARLDCRRRSRPRACPRWRESPPGWAATPAPPCQAGAAGSANGLRSCRGSGAWNRSANSAARTPSSKPAGKDAAKNRRRCGEEGAVGIGAPGNDTRFGILDVVLVLGRAQARDEGFVHRARRSEIGFQRIQLDARYVVAGRLFFRAGEARLDRPDMGASDRQIAGDRIRDAGRFLGNLALQIALLRPDRDHLGMVGTVARRKVGLLTNEVAFLRAQLDDQRRGDDLRNVGRVSGAQQRLDAVVSWLSSPPDPIAPR